jgi:lysine-specific demethylase/histidyl-hydroxylase NO66
VAVRPAAPLKPLAQVEFAGRLTTDDRIVVRDGLTWKLTGDASDHVVLHLAGRTLRLPAYCSPAINAALGCHPQRVGDLPGLDDDADRLVLARRLLKEGLTVPA